MNSYTLGALVVLLALAAILIYHYYFKKPATASGKGGIDWGDENAFTTAISASKNADLKGTPFEKDEVEELNNASEEGFLETGVVETGYVDPAGSVPTATHRDPAMADATILETGTVKITADEEATTIATTGAIEVAEQASATNDPWEHLAADPIAKPVPTTQEDADAAHLSAQANLDPAGQIIAKRKTTRTTSIKKPKVALPETKKPANAAFTDQEIRDIRKSPWPPQVLADHYGVSATTIKRILSRKTYASVK